MNKELKKLGAVTKMSDDEDTAYDEVIQDIWDIGTTFIKNQEAKKLLMAKIDQLRRLTNLEESEG